MTYTLIGFVIIAVIIALHALYASLAKRAIRFGDPLKKAAGQGVPDLYAPVKPPTPLPRNSVWSNYIRDVNARHNTVTR